MPRVLVFVSNNSPKSEHIQCSIIWNREKQQILQADSSDQKSAHRCWVIFFCRFNQMGSNHTQRVLTVKLLLNHNTPARDFKWYNNKKRSIIDYNQSLWEINTLFASGHLRLLALCKGKQVKCKNNICIEAPCASTYGSGRTSEPRDTLAISSARVLHLDNKLGSIWHLYLGWSEWRIQMESRRGCCWGRRLPSDLFFESERKREDGGKDEDVPCVLVNPS